MFIIFIYLATYRFLFGIYSISYVRVGIVAGVDVAHAPEAFREITPSKVPSPNDVLV